MHHVEHVGLGYSRNKCDPESKVMQTEYHVSSVQNPSLIPLYWLVIPNRLGSIIPYNHQPTEVLNTAQVDVDQQKCAKAMGVPGLLINVAKSHMQFEIGSLIATITTSPCYAL